MSGWHEQKVPKVPVPALALVVFADGWTQEHLSVSKELYMAMREVAVKLNLTYAEAWRVAAAQFVANYEGVDGA